MQSIDPIVDTAVDSGLTHELRQAVASLVKAKALADRLAQAGEVDRDLVRKSGLLHGEDGTAFFREIFPFCGNWEPLGPSALRLIPLELTVGNSWRWRPEYVDQEKRASLLERFLTCTDGKERAEICWIVPLGLFLAHEGKNRVAFLRAEGATHYPALTTPYDYPAPDRLSLVQVPGPHGDEWWAVLDQDSIEPLRYPECALSVLLAYGVSTTKGWPEDYPSYAAVRDELAARVRRNFRPLEDPPLSLKSLRSKQEKRDEIVSSSFMDLRDVRLKCGWKRALAALVATILVAIPVLQPAPQELSFLSAGLGAVLMLAVLFFVEILAVPRQHIDIDSR